MNAVHTELEAAVAQLTNDSPVDRVPVGDDVERGAKTTYFLEIREFNCKTEPLGALDVVRQDECGVIRLRPEPAERQLAASACQYLTLGIQAE